MHYPKISPARSENLTTSRTPHRKNRPIAAKKTLSLHMMEKIITDELQQHASREKARILSGFFKTGKGEYGEGDQFIGVTVPHIREVARRHHSTASTKCISALLSSPTHEHRMCALLILTEQFKAARKDDITRKRIVEYYLSNTATINNWDLVDLSAPKIFGEWMLTHPMPHTLDTLSLSDNMWEQRIAIVSTLTLIRHSMFADTLRLADRYLTHTHQLMHKATGWMLREIGKKDMSVLTDYLHLNAHLMPRTTLRYAIERMTETQRKSWLAIKKSNTAARQ